MAHCKELMQLANAVLNCCAIIGLSSFLIFFMLFLAILGIICTFAASKGTPRVSAGLWVALRTRPPEVESVLSWPVLPVKAVFYLPTYC